MKSTSLPVCGWWKFCEKHHDFIFSYIHFSYPLLIQLYQTRLNFIIFSYLHKPVCTAREKLCLLIKCLQSSKTTANVARFFQFSLEFVFMYIFSINIFKKNFSNIENTISMIKTEKKTNTFQKIELCTTNSTRFLIWKLFDY